MLTKFPKRTFNCYWQKTDKLSFSKWKITKLSFAKVPNCHSQKYKIIIRKNTKLSFAKVSNFFSQKCRTHTCMRNPRWRRQQGKNIRDCIMNNRFHWAFFDGLTTSNPVELNFFKRHTTIAEVLKVK